MRNAHDPPCEKLMLTNTALMMAGGRELRGQAKKRYAVGHTLPRGIVIDDVPVELSIRIGRAPAGYRYGMIDGDVVELAVGTMLVIDAIDGLVH